MLEMIATELLKTNQTLDGIVEDVSNNSPTIRPIVARYLALKDGEIRARAALHFLTSGLGMHDPQASLALAVSTELTYTANKIHKEIFYLDETALLSGAAHIRVLTGDYLFSLSSVQVANSNHIAAMKIAIDTLGKISEASLDITYEHLYQRLSQGYGYTAYTADIERRIGVLFEAAVKIGCLLAQVPPTMQQQLVQFGIHLGSLQHLAKNQAEINASPEKTDSLPVDAVELLLVFWNEYCSANGKGIQQPVPHLSGEASKAFYQTAANILQYHQPINELITGKKHELIQNTLNQIPDGIANTDTGKAMVELVRIAELGLIN